MTSKRWILAWQALAATGNSIKWEAASIPEPELFEAESSSHSDKEP